MKALILSGGKGTRLRPITHTSAKQLVPVANKPILFYSIEAIRAAGITEVGIVVGETAAEIRDACGTGSNWGVHITYIQQSAPLGLAHAVMISQDFIGDSPFVVYLGDNLVVDGISSFVQTFNTSSPDALILLANVPNPQDFGVAFLEDGRVVKLEEKPQHPTSNFALVGVYLFGNRIFEAVNAITPSRRGELEITDSIQYLIDNAGKVESHQVTGWWKDTGRLSDMLEANRLVLETISASQRGEVDTRSEVIGNVSLAEGSKIINSVVRGPAIIGADTVIENAYIGPFTSIYHNCTVRNSEIEHSIILEHSRILDIESRIEDSLIGRNVLVSRSIGKPVAYRFMLGDSSEVGII